MSLDITIYKKSFYNLGRRLTNEEWSVLKNWKNDPKNIDARWKLGDLNPQKNGYVFLCYWKDNKDGEYWTPIEKFDPKKIRKANIPSADGRSSYFDFARKPTEKEWEELNKWRQENPHLEWKRGDTRADNTDLVFNFYSKDSRNGEFWSKPETLQKQNEYSKEFINRPEQKEKQSLLRKTPEFRAAGKERSKRWYHKKTPEEKRELYIKHCGAIRAAVRNGMLGTKGGKRSEEILGCTVKEFREYIESKFEDWMTWENQGTVDGKPTTELGISWDLDHIIPLSSAKNDEEILKLNHYTNFQPLCSYINRWVKKDRLDYAP